MVVCTQVFRHEPYGRPVDIYSFSMIAYNCLAGEPPLSLIHI